MYSGKATEQNAARLARSLISIRFFQDRGALALYSQDSGGSTVSVFLEEGAWLAPEFPLRFNLLGAIISGATGTPLKVRVLNKSREMQFERTFGQISVALCPRDRH